MSEPITIALDAMGGDNAPHIVLAGANIARQRHPDVRFLLFGDAGQIEDRLKKLKGLSAAVEVHHTSDVVRSDDKPSQVMRSGRSTSMRLAIDAVKEGRADGIVSAGNTGALMAMAILVLRTLPGIDRPAITSFFPTMRGESVMLDLGANAVCSTKNLVQFAIMGEVFARTVLGAPQPRVGLLNIGSEDMKGTETLRQAAQILREADMPLDFRGFIEGDDISTGVVDVIVTDGFTGNVALKTAEGTAKLISVFVREAFRSSFAAKIGYVFAKRSLDKLRLRTDPRRYNGAMLLGLNGVCVKSHGGTDALGFATAIGVAADLIRQAVNRTIADQVAHIAGRWAEEKAQAAV